MEAEKVLAMYTRFFETFASVWKYLQIFNQGETRRITREQSISESGKPESDLEVTSLR